MAMNAPCRLVAGSYFLCELCQIRRKLRYFNACCFYWREPQSRGSWAIMFCCKSGLMKVCVLPCSARKNDLSKDVAVSAPGLSFWCKCGKLPAKHRCTSSAVPRSNWWLLCHGWPPQLEMKHGAWSMVSQGGSLSAGDVEKPETKDGTLIRYLNLHVGGMSANLWLESRDLLQDEGQSSDMPLEAERAHGSEMLPRP